MNRRARSWKIFFPAGALVLFAVPIFASGLSCLHDGPVRELKVRMSVGSAAPDGRGLLPFRPEFARLEISERRTATGTLPRERRPELSEDLLVLAAVNVRGEDIYRFSRPDPRLVRAETADEAGRLTSTLLYRESVEFWISVPDDPELDKIVFFHPQWTGESFLLVPIGEVRVR